MGLMLTVWPIARINRDCVWAGSMANGGVDRQGRPIPVTGLRGAVSVARIVVVGSRVLGTILLWRNRRVLVMVVDASKSLAHNDPSGHGVELDLYKGTVVSKKSWISN